MAHELDITNGVASFAARTDAWHRLGQTVGHSMTAEEALASAQLSGWSVHKRRLVIPLEPVITDNGVTTPAPLPVADHFATVRTNPITGKIDVLGVVGSKYEPVQNEESCALLNALTDESGAVFETAGALRGGRETFVTMRLPESMSSTASTDPRTAPTSTSRPSTAMTGRQVPFPRYPRAHRVREHPNRSPSTGPKPASASATPAGLAQPSRRPART